MRQLATTDETVAPRIPGEKGLRWGVAGPAPALRVAVLAISGVVAVSGCQEGASAPSVPLDVRSSDMRAADIPDEAVAGTLRGEAFEVVDVGFRPNRMVRRERFDLFLSDVEIDRCGLPLATGGIRVWLRFPGTSNLEEGEFRIDPDTGEPAFSVSYEYLDDGQWRGVSGGAALVVVEALGRRSVRGRLHACFDDGLGSCVKGSFRARECIAELDVDDPVMGSGHESLESAPPRPSAPRNRESEPPAGPEPPAPTPAVDDGA